MSSCETHSSSTPSSPRHVSGSRLTFRTLNFAALSAPGVISEKTCIMAWSLAKGLLGDALPGARAGELWETTCETMAMTTKNANAMPLWAIVHGCALNANGLGREFCIELE